MATKPVSEMGPIREGECYPLELFKRNTGLSVWAFREAKRAGLKVRRVGRRGYVLGADWLAFLNREER